MVDLRHIQKQFEELAASMTAEQRVEREGQRQETLAKIAMQQERILASYRQMEQMLAQYRAMEVALATVGLAEKIRRLAETSRVEAAFAELTRADELQRSTARLMEPSRIEAAMAELARVRELERLFGLSTCGLLAESNPRGLFAEVQVIRLQEQLFKDALNPRSLVEESLFRLTVPSPLSSVDAEFLHIEEIKREPHSSTLPADHWAVKGNEPDGEAPVENVPEVPTARVPSRRPSLKERRTAAYYVLLEDIRRESEASPILDELAWRMHVLLVAMERDVGDSGY